MTPAESIQGIQKLQRANQRMIAALKPDGALGRMAQVMTAETHRRAVANTPWDTGGLRASHRMMVQGARGEVYIDPSVSNPRQGGKKPAEYGEHLHNQGMRPGIRGGTRAFYQYTVEREGEQIANQAMKDFVKALPDGN
jgi:hypothetical protein